MGFEVKLLYAHDITVIFFDCRLIVIIMKSCDGETRKPRPRYLRVIYKYLSCTGIETATASAKGNLEHCQSFVVVFSIFISYVFDLIKILLSKLIYK